MIREDVGVSSLSIELLFGKSFRVPPFAGILVVDSLLAFIRSARHAGDWFWEVQPVVLLGEACRWTRLQVQAEYLPTYLVSTYLVGG